MTPSDKARCRQLLSNTHHTPATVIQITPLSLHSPSQCCSWPTPFAPLPLSHCDAHTRTTRPLGWPAECGAKAGGGGSLCASGRTAVPKGWAADSSSAIRSASIRLFCSRSGLSCIPCHGTEQRHLYRHSRAKSLPHPNKHNSLLGRRLLDDTCLCRQLKASHPYVRKPIVILAWK